MKELTNCAKRGELMRGEGQGYGGKNSKKTDHVRCLRVAIFTSKITHK